MDIQTTKEDQVAADHRNCVWKAAEETVAASCGMELHRLDDGGRQCFDGNGVLLAIISVVGDIDWTIFLGLPPKTAEALAVKFAGFEIPFDSDDMGDAMGELANIMAGRVKANLDTLGMDVDISLPSVLRGRSLEVLISHDSSTKRVLFDCDAGNFWTGVMLRKSVGGGEYAHASER